MDVPPAEDKQPWTSLVGSSVTAVLKRNPIKRSPWQFLAELCAHIPDPNEKTATSYGWYSNGTRGLGKAYGLLVPATAAVAAAQADRTPLAIR